MLNLTFDNLKRISSPSLSVPDESLFQLPEKVLQFGTGVLLRGLPDYYIDQANRKGAFGGRVIAVKSTDRGPIDAFDKQDGLYTLSIKGIENENSLEENMICSSISRVLPATTHWKEIEECAGNPDLSVIISNSTEAGIQLVREDLHQSPPVSFPGKLLAFLYRRYEKLPGSATADMVIIPTELIPDNGLKLKDIIKELAVFNGLHNAFWDWLEHHIHFCNSLVDRIVPGRPDQASVEIFEKEFGYHDELLITAEPYNLWAIEGDDHIASMLSFSRENKGMIITPDINLYREIKLRLLNGTHTLCCGTAFLAGIETVKAAMDHTAMYDYIRQLMFDEISPSIPYAIEKRIITDFAQKTLDRFRNPYIRHLWINITQQYSMKMKMRVVPVLLQYYQLFHRVPDKMATGFAAYLLFMKIMKKRDHQYFGENSGIEYPVTDDQAAYFYEQWRSCNHDSDMLVEGVLKNTNLWGTDLTMLPGFSDTTKEKLQKMLSNGVMKVLQEQTP